MHTQYHRYTPALDKTFSEVPGNEKERNKEVDELENLALSPLILTQTSSVESLIDRLHMREKFFCSSLYRGNFQRVHFLWKLIATISTGMHNYALLILRIHVIMLLILRLWKPTKIGSKEISHSMVLQLTRWDKQEESVSLKGRYAPLSTLTTSTSEFSLVLTAFTA